MRIVNLTAYENGAHNNCNGDFITSLPDGWAMIPEGFPVPDTFPFVSIEAEEKTYTREVKVPTKREVPVLDEEGNPVLDQEGNPVTKSESCMGTEQVPYTMMTVTSMTPGIVPEPAPEPPAPPTTEERLSAIEDALCEMYAANAASIAALEDALCEIDAGGM